MKKLKPSLSKSWESVKHKSETWLLRKGIWKAKTKATRPETDKLPSDAVWKGASEGLDDAEKLLVQAYDGYEAAISSRGAKEREGLRSWSNKLQDAKSQLDTTKKALKETFETKMRDIPATTLPEDRQQAIAELKRGYDVQNARHKKLVREILQHYWALNIYGVMRHAMFK